MIHCHRKRWTVRFSSPTSMNWNKRHLPPWPPRVNILSGSWPITLFISSSLKLSWAYLIQMSNHPIFNTNRNISYVTYYINISSVFLGHHLIVDLLGWLSVNLMNHLQDILLVDPCHVLLLLFFRWAKLVKQIHDLSICSCWWKLGWLFLLSFWSCFFCSLSSTELLLQYLYPTFLPPKWESWNIETIFSSVYLTWLQMCWGGQNVRNFLVEVRVICLNIVTLINILYYFLYTFIKYKQI